MKTLKPGLVLLGLLLIAGTVLSVLQAKPSKDEPPGYAVLGADLEPFRSDFNAKVENVRAVLLVSPT